MYLQEDILGGNVAGKPRRVVDAIRTAAERHRPQSLALGRRSPVLVLLKPEADHHGAWALIVHAANLARLVSDRMPAPQVHP